MTKMRTPNADTRITFATVRHRLGFVSGLVVSASDISMIVPVSGSGRASNALDMESPEPSAEHRIETMR